MYSVSSRPIDLLRPAYFFRGDLWQLVPPKESVPSTKFANVAAGLFGRGGPSFSPDISNLCLSLFS